MVTINQASSTKVKLLSVMKGEVCWFIDARPRAIYVLCYAFLTIPMPNCHFIRPFSFRFHSVKRPTYDIRQILVPIITKWTVNGERWRYIYIYLIIKSMSNLKCWTWKTQIMLCFMLDARRKRILPQHSLRWWVDGALVERRTANEYESFRII